MTYLHPEQQYIDRYDLLTIEECLEYYRPIREKFLKEKDTHFAKYTQEKFEEEMNKCLNLMVNVIKGERYRHKKETIQKWMDADRRMQELHDNTPPPQNIYCQDCHSTMVVTSKHMHDSYEPDARMTFMFGCPQCKKRQALFEDGLEWIYEPPICPKCKHELKMDIKIEGDVTTFTSNCSNCGYKDVDVSDHAKFRQEQEAKEKRGKELLEKYRKDLCLSDKDGDEYVEMANAVEVGVVVREEERQKYDNPAYERASHIKKTPIADLEKLLTEKLEKARYTKLSFAVPEIGQYVIVPFTVQDSDSSRKDRMSSSELEKLIKTTLEDTNWRLLSNSVTYRLGYLKGQLKGYEQEEDILKLAGKEEKPKPKSKLDEAKRQKYEHSNEVQFSRLMGELDGIQAMRKRRLEKEPDGFLLNDGKEGYTCGICGESMSGNTTWWDLNGIRCPDCQRNLKEGVVPLAIFEKDYGYDVVVKEWEMNSDYGLHPSTMRKLVRNGELKARELKRKDGKVYKMLFVVSENREFFDAHPKRGKL